MEDHVQVLRPQLVGGGGQQEEGHIFGGRGDFGVFPVEDDALELLLLVPEEDVLLPELAVDDGVEGGGDLPPHAAEHLRHPGLALQQQHLP